ncbi:MAG: cation transporter [Pseudomonadota bacterium]|nr:cation transporter [Pseudomonadota bacterium]
MACNCEVKITDASQKSLLITLLTINAAFFVLEIGVGWYAESTGLIADSLDMLADAIVYGIAIYAITRSDSLKANAALLSGYFQLLLALLVGFEVIRRSFYGSEPISELMMIMGFLALLANAYCLKLIFKHRNGEVHMRASWIFSANDVLANLGVIIGGVLVFWLDSRIPDLIIGTIISLFILSGALYIIRDAKSELSQIKLLNPEKSECSRHKNEEK